MANWRAHRCSMHVILPLQNRRGSLRQLCSALPCATVEEAFVWGSLKCLERKLMMPIESLVRLRLWSNCGGRQESADGTVFSAHHSSDLLSPEQNQHGPPMTICCLQWHQAIGFSSQPWSCVHDKWWVMVDQYVYMTVLRLPLKRSCQCSRTDPSRPMPDTGLPGQLTMLSKVHVGSTLSRHQQKKESTSMFRIAGQCLRGWIHKVCTRGDRGRFFVAHPLTVERCLIPCHSWRTLVFFLEDI